MALLEHAARLVGLAGPPRAEVWERWAVNDPTSPATVDHGAWDRFLSRHVACDAAGLDVVRYGAVGAADRAGLETYVAALAATPVSRLAPREQFTYWVNLYNALTVRVVLDHYPVASIRDIKLSGPLGRGPWDKKLIVVEGESIAIGEIEHRILRPIWREPRVHVVLNCASYGCPDIGTRAFTTEGAEATMDRAAANFVNHPRGARFEAGALVLSSIFDWYAADFAPAGPLAFVRRYAAPDLAAALNAGPKITYDYDWRLNDAVATVKGAHA